MEGLPLRPIDRLQAAKDAMLRRFHTRAVLTGEIRLPAVPSMVDEYVSMCSAVFAGLGKPFSDGELAHLKGVLEGQLAEAYAASTRSQIVISYNATVGPTLNYTVRAQWNSIAQAYENWLETRQPPLFGTEPDARVWQLSGEVADPASHRVLEIGGGTGRNALALARRGHPVDVVEMTPKFAEMLRADADRESLDVRVIVRDVFAGADDLRDDYQMMVISEVLTDFRSTEQLRSLFELAARCLAPGGLLVFNSFLAHDGYEPDAAAREFCQQVYSGLFTRDEMSIATAGLPLQLLSDESAYDYEKAHLPEGAWPQTSWYPDWAAGLDAFRTSREESPMELRWLVYERTRY
ncbi:class I SAM-dependent methyltransferase [Mycolicibacter longobardus]|uniref:Methyltransferase type 12 n=1 Tax=Mycolicibacter longobardus TaxID=1108812 RepID=A0A1X1YQE0_9MYCO|nr:class I SAM-dependent methyltransferase [Mycolicibacter longobardus]MCV7382686.1 class I SAM-dependent methyltransferase [Mycolicibacter longobardus]ORW13230.1 methyltransferase type 12 [Mycolicibacter longobardus]